MNQRYVDKMANNFRFEEVRIALIISVFMVLMINFVEL